MTCMYHNSGLFRLLAVLLFAGFGQLAYTAEPPTACERKVLKASAELSKCQLARRAKGLETEKCDARFQRAYDRAVARFGAANCPGGDLLGEEIDSFILDQTSGHAATVSAAVAGKPTTILQIVNNTPKEYGNSSKFEGQLMQQSISVFVPTQDGSATDGCPNPSAGCKIDPQQSLTWSMTNTTNSVVGIQWNLARYDSSHGPKNTCDNACQQQVIDVATCTSTYHIPGTRGPGGMIPPGDCSKNVAGPAEFDPAPYWQATIVAKKQGEKCIINLTSGKILRAGTTTHLCSCDFGQYPCNSNDTIWHDCSTEPPVDRGPGCP